MKSSELLFPPSVRSSIRRINFSTISVIFTGVCRHQDPFLVETRSGRLRSGTGTASRGQWGPGAKCRWSRSGGSSRLAARPRARTSRRKSSPFLLAKSCGDSRSDLLAHDNDSAQMCGSNFTNYRVSLRIYHPRRCWLRKKTSTCFMYT